METSTSTGSKNWLPPLPSGLLFGAMASLFNNIAVSFAFFLVNLFFTLFLATRLPEDFTAYWVLDLSLLAFAALIGSIGIWLGIKVAAYLAKRESVHPSTSHLPLYGSLVLAAPIFVWTLIQIIYDVATVGMPVWKNISYLLGQALIFSGVAYVLLMRYKKHCKVSRGTLAPAVHTDLSTMTVVRSVLMVFGGIGLIVALHAIEAMLRTEGISILGLTDGLFASNAVLLLTLVGVTVISYAAAFFLGHTMTAAHLKVYRSFRAWEYFLATFSFAAGLTYALAFALEVGFVFSPYAVLPTTLAVLSGISFSALRYGKGRRDRAFVVSRTVAYIAGFVSQPAILGTIIPVLQQILS